jgi:signal transduction histidine kinase
MTICAHQIEGLQWPNLEICPYTQICDTIDAGVMILDIKNEKVVSQNRCALSFFKHVENPYSYSYFHSLLSLGISGPELKMKKSGQFTINISGIICAYTAYYISNSLLWIFITDITDKKRLESITESIEIMDNVGYIFSGIRHEIGNPINSIKMTLSVLKNNLNKFSKELISQYVERSLDEVLRVEYLLKSLKSFSLYERAEIEKMDVSDFLGKLLRLIGEDFLKKGVTLSYEVQTEVKIMADPRLLQQVMLNILVNAVDALEGRKDARITINVTRYSNLVWMRLEDNGCGINPEQLREIFKPFYTSKESGTGLGLPIVRKMLASMNCTIEVKSEENIGTTIIMSLPKGTD